MDDALSTSGKIKNVGDGEYPRWIFEADDGLSICVEPEPDGRRRFARVLNMLRTQHDEVPIDDTAVANAVSAPSPREPDLVVILGPPTHLPTSLVWELAYSELVFLDLGWTNLTAADLELAVDDFTRRNRRFGGLDS
jgi:undecaprenyl diphosphate synthase